MTIEKVQTYKRGISAFISSEKGQRFFNFAYSIGAAVVIWGALFKILHLPGGNTLLSIGMGTEVLMFVLTAFDRPPKEYKWEEVFPALGDGDQEGIEPITGGGFGGQVVAGYPSANGKRHAAAAVGIAEGVNLTDEQTASVADSIAKMAHAAEQMATIANDLQQFHASTTALNQVSEVLLQSYRSITENSESIRDSSQGYVDQMQALHQNLGGLNTIYELQLRSVSSQLDAIDRVNRGIKDIRDMYEKSASQSARYCEETEKMARYMQQLNSVYEKMVTAMTVNMYRPVMTPDLDGVPVTPEHTVHAQANK